MGSYTKNSDSLQDIARIMSERTGYKVRAKDVRCDVNTVSTSIYSVVIYEKEDGEVTDATSIICTVRNGKYKVESHKLH